MQGVRHTLHDTNLGGADRVPHEESACAKLMQAGGHHCPVAHMQQWTPSLREGCRPER